MSKNVCKRILKNKMYHLFYKTLFLLDWLHVQQLFVQYFLCNGIGRDIKELQELTMEVLRAKRVF